MMNGHHPGLTIHTTYSCTIDEKSDVVRCFGIPVDRVSLDDAIRQMHDAAQHSKPLHVITLNPEYVMRARNDRALRGIIEAAGLRVADGVGLTVAARLLGVPLPARITGNDLIAALAAEGVPLFLLGAAPGVAAEAAAALRAQHPNAQIAGTWAGDAGPGDAAEARRRINDTGAKVVLVAYGMPKQDYWIARNLPHLAAPVAIGVGGAFDYLSGRVPRAPRLLRRVGLEWAYRLVRQPWRWRRVLTVWQFAGLVLREAVRQRLPHRTRQEEQ